MTNQNKLSGEFRSIPVELLHPNPFQARRAYSQDYVDILARSFIERGNINPIVVTRHPDRDGEFYIVSGEHRWRAAQAAMWGEIDCKILHHNLSDKDMAIDSIIENLKRNEMEPLDMSFSLDRLVRPIEEGGFGMLIEEAANSVDISRPMANNYLRLLKLPMTVQALIDSGDLDFSKARLIAGLPKQFQERMGKACAHNGWNLKQLEYNTKFIASIGKKSRKKVVAGNADLDKVQKLITEKVGTQALVKERAGRYLFSMDFDSPDTFQGLLDLLDIDVDD